MNIAIIGCGYVADYYIHNLKSYPELKLISVMDCNQERSKHFSEYHQVKKYESLEQLLNNSQINIILNLTNPDSHFSVSKAALESGKHVYSEKPLAMDFREAKELVDLAIRKNLIITSAPCNILSESAQTLWKKLRNNEVGTVRVVYAEMDDGMLHTMPYKKWFSKSGIPWPYHDEFQIGCTMEHAGYYLTWLTAFFGPAESVTSFASIQVPDKIQGESEQWGPDFSVACIKFKSGIVTRLTCSILAQHDHRLKIFGDKGVLTVKDCWDYYSPVYSQKMLKIRRKTFFNPLKKRHPLLKSNIPRCNSNGAQNMDFARGVAEVAASIKEKRPCRLSPQFSLHVNEIALAIHQSKEQSETYKMTTSFDPIEPMPWAQ